MGETAPHPHAGTEDNTLPQGLVYRFVVRTKWLNVREALRAVPDTK